MKREDIKIHAVNYENDLLNTISGNVLEICEEIHLMPDTHIGATVPIGFVGKVQPNKIIPEMVGVDIGCGMTAVKISNDIELDLDKLFETITKHIPSGFDVREEILKVDYSFLDNIVVPIGSKKLDRLKRSLGTLGGGNHFIELNEFENYYLLVVHSGSRNLGATICDYYTKTYMNEVYNEKSHKQAIQYIKGTFDKSEWQNQISKIDKKDFMINIQCLTGKLFDNYINDMNIALEYARKNRFNIIQEILRHWLGLGVGSVEIGAKMINVPHNYYNSETNMLYKGAIDASLGNDVIVPINMRDGVILGKGKGNVDWLCGAPHGAGRILSRSQARKKLNVEDMQNQMKDVYSKTINDNTLDEHPDAYRNIDEIMSVLDQSVSDIEIGKVIFNFKGDN